MFGYSIVAGSLALHFQVHLADCQNMLRTNLLEFNFSNRLRPSLLEGISPDAQRVEHGGHLVDVGTEDPAMAILVKQKSFPFILLSGLT